jgi:hypothetical protein
MARTFQRSFIGGEIAERMFGRVEDSKHQNGAATLQNMLVLPQGPARKRPGFKFVREVRNSANKTWLIPFAYSQDQTLVIEMGNDSIDSRDIGYFRFHTDGGTVLYDLPRTYKAPATITAEAASVFTATGHGFNDGDPVVLTMHPTTEACTMAMGDPGIVTHVGHGFIVNQQVMFENNGGSLPSEVEDRRIYYVQSTPDLDTYTISTTPGVGSLNNNTPLAFDASSGATINQAALPRMSSPDQSRLRARETYYMIELTADTFSLARTREDALNGTAMLVQSAGTADRSDIRVHYDDRVGDLVNFSNTCWYCFRRPTTGFDTNFITFDDHDGHDPSDTNFWMRQIGGDNNNTLAGTPLSFDDTLDEVDFGPVHGFAEGDIVVFSGTGTMPTGLAIDTVYYVRNPASDKFQVALSPGGTVIDFTGSGSGTLEVVHNPILEVPHFYTLAEIPEVRYAQSNDIITFTHPHRPARDLRRLGPAQWESEDVRINSAVAPTDVDVTRTLGFGYRVTAVTAADPAALTTSEAHQLAAFTDTIMLVDIGDIPDGIYTTNAATGTTLDLAELDTHDNYDHTGGDTTIDPDTSRIQPVLAGLNFEATYTVTSTNEFGEQSAAGSEVTVTNNLLAEGAYNTVTWGAVSGAQTYRVYKKELGVFGFIGEVRADQPLSFDDENIAPDLSLTPPIKDETLVQSNIVTFDSSNDRVNWVDHGFVAGTPVIFQSSGALPANLTDYQTYYVLAPGQDGFQVVADPADTVGIILTTGDTDERHEAFAGQFPAAVGYYEQRRVFAGALVAPQRVWMTAAGTDTAMSYSLPTVDSDRIRFDVSAREHSAIRHVMPLSHLMLLSVSTEFRVTPLNEDGITPTSISVRPHSFIGASKVQPVIVNNLGIFAGDRGGHLREAGFSQASAISYLTGDLSLRSTHLFDGLTIEQITYAKAPNPTVWCVSSSGKLLGLTYIPEEAVAAWHQHDTRTGEVFESCAAVAEGMEDRLYVVVQRTINSSTVRYIERMDAQQDAARWVHLQRRGHHHDRRPVALGQ